ncbi:MAG: DUF6268 family outer membrane beta-barrel protein [Candidatus Omnitrophica bacterium]|nr:DUF6268 family outer membrane beta-barrel protein [Candidatus Omnitrophota bacterium]
MKTLFFAVLFIFTAFFSCGGLFAEDQYKQENETITSEAYVKYIPPGEVQDSSGKIGIVELEHEFDYHFKAFGELPVKVSVDTLYIGINSSAELELPAHLTGAGANIETTLPFFGFNETYLRLGLNPSFYSDNWDFRSTAFALPIHTCLIRVLNDKWTLVGGIAVYPGFEESVFPVLGFIYRPNDRLTFNIVPQRPNITYSLNEKTSVSLEADAFLDEEFNVGRKDKKNAVLEYKEISFGGGIKYKFNRYIECSVSTGAVIDRSLKYRDTLEEVQVKDGLYTQLRVEIKI